MTEIMQAAAWRNNGTVAHTFRSGRTARIRVVGTDFFLKAGRVPDTLTPMVAKLFREGGDIFRDVVQEVEAAQEFSQFLDVMTQAMFVEPRVTETATEDTLGLDDVFHDEKLELWNIMMLPSAKVRSFREEQNDAVGDVVSEQGRKAKAK